MKDFFLFSDSHSPLDVCVCVCVCVSISYILKKSIPISSTRIHKSSLSHGVVSYVPFPCFIMPFPPIELKANHQEKVIYWKSIAAVITFLGMVVMYSSDWISA